MTAATAALLALVLAVALLLSHRTAVSLRNPTTRVGIAAVALGFGLLAVYWVGVEFGVLERVSTQACAAVLGLGDHPGSVIEVHRQVHPPMVVCAADGVTRPLTPASTTESWSHTWVAGWTAVWTGVVALAAGLVRSRGWRRPPAGG